MIKPVLPRRQRENSARFCEDFILRQQMRAEYPNDSYEQNDFPCVEKVSAPRAWDSDIKVGDIRVLSQTAETQYVVVLERRDWNYLVVPFSPFSEPATDGELKLNWVGGLYLEVAQVWNARTINFLQLAKSWFVAELPERVMDEIRAVRANYLLGDPLPENLLDRIGAPIFASDDPRI
ncbi:MAG: hypothetical protein MJ016_03205, partial [Victivallaceae bacterium]|nr:hypothetical protein [Victivallaceae bacterium]